MAQKIYNNSAAAVKNVYKKIDSSFPNNASAIFDGTWHTRGYRSLIDVGSVIKFHVDVIFDAVVLLSWLPDWTQTEDESF